jgi:hypothetical protein
MSAIEINNEVSEEIKVFNNADQKKEQRAMDRRLAFIKTRHRKLVEEGKMPAPESRLAKVDEEVDEMVKRASSVKQETTRLPFITGIGNNIPKKARKEKPVILEDGLKEQILRRGIDPEHLICITDGDMEKIQKMLKKVPELGQKNFAAQGKGSRYKECSDNYSLVCRAEGKQFSGSSDIGDGVR